MQSVSISSAKNQPKLAVIIPVFNTSMYVRDMLQDLQRQTYSNLTAFLIDDGSKDNSLELLQQIAKSDCRIQVISKSNGGPGSARNAGLDLIAKKNLKFDYIWFCDSDDRIESTAIAKLISAMERNNSDYGLMSVRRFDKVSEKTYPAHFHKELLLDHEDIIRQYFRYGWKWRKEPSSEAFLNNKIFRFDIVKNFRFREDIFRAEDFDFFFRLLPRLRNGVLVPNAFYRYRLRKSSLTNSYDATGDLLVCSMHYPELEDRTRIEQISMQHRLIRAYYLDACRAFNKQDIKQFEVLLKSFATQTFDYPFMLGDWKILALMKYVRALLPSFIKFRNSTKKSNTLENYYE